MIKYNIRLLFLMKYFAQSAGAVKYTDCNSAVR